jgi:hypothetical protein
MRNRWKWALGGGALALSAAIAVNLPQVSTEAADHFDPAVRTEPGVDPNPDFAADIADIYAWYTADSVVVAVTFAGPMAASNEGFYDRDVLYQIFINNSFNPATGAPQNPQSTSYTIEGRFGEDTAAPGTDNFGIRVSGLPAADRSASVTITGPAETILCEAGQGCDGPISQTGIKVYTGLVSDPFTFDLVGFRATRDSQPGGYDRLLFDNSRDFFEGKNDSVIVIEIPKERIVYTNNGALTPRADFWTRTLRFGGNI